MIDFCRMDACPRCRHGIDASTTPEDAAACPVCRGRPVRVLVIWNEACDARWPPAGTDHTNRALQIRHALAGEAAIVAADLLDRPAGACGPVVRTAALDSKADRRALPPPEAT